MRAPHAVAFHRGKPIIGYTKKGRPIFPIMGGAAGTLVQGGRSQAYKRLPQTTGAPDTSQASPFIRNARRHSELAFDTGALAFGSLFGPRDVPAIGYLRNIFLDINATGGSGGSAVYNANNQAPANAITSLQFLDITGQALVDVSSYDLLLINMFGGYLWAPDPRQWPFASNFTAVAAASGNFRFQEIVPAELLADAYGAIPNENAAAAAKMRLQLATSAQVYSTPPASVLPTVDVRADVNVWTRPLQGTPTPPGVGSTGYWSKQVYPISSGFQTVKLTRVGNYIHNLVCFVLNATPAPLDISTMTDIRLRVDGVDMIGPITYVKLWSELYQDYGFQAAVTGGFGAPNAGFTQGVIIFPFRNDVGHPDRGESAELWLPTTGATRLEIAGTFPANSTTLNVLTGDVIPEGAVEHLAVS